MLILGTSTIFSMDTVRIRTVYSPDEIEAGVKIDQSEFAKKAEDYFRAKVALTFMKDNGQQYRECSRSEKIGGYIPSLLWGCYAVSFGWGLWYCAKDSTTVLNQYIPETIKGLSSKVLCAGICGMGLFASAKSAARSAHVNYHYKEETEAYQTLWKTKNVSAFKTYILDAAEELKKTLAEPKK